MSKSSRPASGIGPRTRLQIESIAPAVIGFSTQPIAPAECVASCASQLLGAFVGAENRYSAVLSRVHAFLKSLLSGHPSKGCREIEQPVSGTKADVFVHGSVFIPSSQVTTLKSLWRKMLDSLGRDIWLLSTRSTVGASSSSTSVTPNHT